MVGAGAWRGLAEVSPRNVCSTLFVARNVCYLLLQIEGLLSKAKFPKLLAQLFAPRNSVNKKSCEKSANLNFFSNLVLPGVCLQTWNDSGANGATVHRLPQGNGSRFSFGGPTFLGHVLRNTNKFRWSATRDRFTFSTYVLEDPMQQSIFIRGHRPQQKSAATPTGIFTRHTYLVIDFEVYAKVSLLAL